MVAIKTLLPLALAALTSASSLATAAKRALISADTLIADIQGIDDGVNELKADLETYQGGVLSQTPILGAFTVIELANRKGYADAHLASNFSAADSTRIVQFTTKSVGYDIPASVEVLKSKKAIFESQGEGPVILGSLEVLLYDHLSFSYALLAHITADIEQGYAVVYKIRDSIQSGIDYYSS